MRSTKPALAIALCLTLAGCGGGDSDPAPSKPATKQSPATPPGKGGAAKPPAKAATAGSAVVSGRVTFEGTVPSPRTVVVTKDADQCGPAAGAVQEVHVSEGGGLAGVIVEVQGVDAPSDGWTWTNTDDDRVITQKGCRFEPNLLVIPAGTTVEVRNADQVTHNVNTGEWNVLQAADDAPIVRPITSKLPVKVTCNIHSWMETWVYPARSPLYAVTDANGDYRIDGIPAGRYRLNFWHPALAAERERVELKDGGEVEQNLVFESPVRD